MTRMITVVVLALIASEAAAANLIVNGDFETPVVVGLDDEFDAPSSAIAGWSVTSGSVDVNTSGSSVLGDAHTGLQMLDINGASAGTIQQTFATTPGRSYVLELYYSNNPNPSFAEPSYSATVSVIGGSTLFQQNVTHAGATQANMNWLLFSQAFVANSSSTTLKLQSSQSGFNGVYFDSVSVTPEPSSFVLTIVAGCGLLISRRRDRTSIGPIRQLAIAAN